MERICFDDWFFENKPGNFEFAIIQNVLGFNDDPSFYIGDFSQRNKYTCGNLIKIFKEEIEELNLMPICTLNKALLESKSIEIGGRVLEIGDFVIGFTSVLSKHGQADLIPGLYLGRKQIFTSKGKVSCKLVYKLDPRFQTQNDKEIKLNLVQLYNSYQNNQMKENLRRKTNKILNYSSDDVLSSSKSMSYLYLGEVLSNKQVYIQLDTKTNTQLEFIKFLSRKVDGKFFLQGFINYSIVKLDIYQFTFNALCKMMLQICSAKKVVLNSRKEFLDISGRIELERFYDFNLLNVYNLEL